MSAFGNAFPKHTCVEAIKYYELALLLLKQCPVKTLRNVKKEGIKFQSFSNAPIK